MTTRSSNILLVEGDDDRQLIYQLLNFHKISRDSYEVIDKRGYENLIGTLDVELDRSELKNLGIIVDADDHPENRWNSLRNKLMEYGYSTVPVDSNSDGTIITLEHRPKVGIWMMPDNLSSGAVEDFAQMLIPEQDRLWPRVQSSIEQIPTTERLFPEHHLMKAQIHTWLAWQEEPGKPMGLAIKKRYLTGNAPQAQLLLGWIKNLFQFD